MAIYIYLRRMAVKVRFSAEIRKATPNVHMNDSDSRSKLHAKAHISPD